MQAYSHIFESLQLESSYVGDLTVYRIIAEVGELLERWFVKNTDYISTLGYIISGEVPSTNGPNYFDGDHLTQNGNGLWIPRNSEFYL